MHSSVESNLSALYRQTFGAQPDQLLPLKRTASGRQYFRLTGKGKNAIGTFGPNPKENEAFLYFSRHFRAKGIPVPEIFGANSQQGIYIQTDLGSTTLYDLLPKDNSDIGPALRGLYKKVLEQLADLQIRGGEGLDYGKCTPRSDFDRQSMRWDLNYFKYFFVQLVNIPFDEDALERDFHTLADHLLQADCGHFMFRDFQSRNIMIVEDEPWFIDYQGGRRGASQYDLASLLYQPAAQMSEAARQELLQHYLVAAENLRKLDRAVFTDYFYGYVLIRRLQALGTYGRRGLYERYSHFLASIPVALAQIEELFESKKLTIPLPEIERVIREVVKTGRFTNAMPDQIDVKEPNPNNSSTNSSKLTVRINSFSYKTGLPDDPSGNGGGFVFDCRFLNNPGRYQPYKKQTGRDASVIKFLQTHSNIDDFLNNVYHIVDEAVEDYLRRSFTHLMISFGCTGGQHRSVYAADQLAKHIRERYNVDVLLNHMEQERKGWVN